jgi:hypothetical protein
MTTSSLPDALLLRVLEISVSISSSFSRLYDPVFLSHYWCFSPLVLFSRHLVSAWRLVSALVFNPFAFLVDYNQLGCPLSSVESSTRLLLAFGSEI